ncbi:spermidine synthase [Rhodopseudomonas julia]|uniref:Spermidine synthase n=1 Tax=Rhodopseudomonas julia TaxID=200617 RepID=A0ABU0C520_9BRAD|nr:spermidine synthase [Rhodopseudomonas julia]MDQ0325026.1 spermidine synthase [Rhodopseudomonas julia]
MLPWLKLDTAPLPAGGEMRLMQRGGDFAIMVGRAELMNSRQSGSEEALAHLACARISNRKRPHILIGGLGMGFTLRAALADLPPEARVTVAELVPAVVAWAGGPLAELYGTSLSDPRVTIVEEDVARLIADANGTYDAILLDVDNGPDGLVAEDNETLYAWRGLGAARRALTAGGVLAIWSAAPDRAFADRLRQSGFAVAEQKVRARSNGAGARHVIWLATRSSGDQAAQPAPRRRTRR